ncbi:hypothetical protein HC358_02415 [Wolbachia pipientis]|uniref:Uncharacterized protein n=1 Tax=Wolbachia pipientis TaxID=955 RepID=A0A7G5C9R2_WOLPI|nr:hypothetical protein [Wolbachia pipientis]QMV45946.1 hypothetical protein HC358_02415 [Wolbachia pipientis]
MHSSNDNGGGIKRDSCTIIEQIGLDEVKTYELQRERSKPNTQLDSSSATSAGSSKDKRKSKWCCC